MSPYFKFVNKFLHLFEVRRMYTSGEYNIYLTFDDGPETGITEFILNELDKYHFHATFFCKGINAEVNNNLMKMIIEKGNAIGNHSYSHIHGFKCSVKEYLKDIEKADRILHSHLFRPPWGALKLSQFIKLRREYKIVYWSLVSGDTQLDLFDLDSNLNRLKQRTRKGDVVLFHCCRRHEKETRQILPPYLKWLNEQGYKTGLL